MVTQTDIGWAAGFIEGEGSFFAYHRRPGSLHIRISAAQVNMEPLNKLKGLFGGTIYKLKKRQEHHQQCHVWAIGGIDAYILGLVLYPHLSEKRREQAAIALTEFNAHKQVQGNYRKWCRKGHLLSEVGQAPIKEIYCKACWDNNAENRKAAQRRFWEKRHARTAPKF